MRWRWIAWLYVTALVVVSCVDDVRVLYGETDIETTAPIDDSSGSGGEDDPPPIGGYGLVPEPVGGSGGMNFYPCGAKRMEPNGTCYCPQGSSCYCESSEQPCSIDCPEGFCDLQCAYASIYCGFTCSYGCNAVCPDMSFCALNCDGGCTVLCLPNSICEVSGIDVMQPTYVYCEMGATCTCQGDPNACICEGPGFCQSSI